MSVTVPPAEPATGPVRFAGGGGARACLRALPLVLAGLVTLGALAVLAFELTAARVPQYRAALEGLIREQTGLEVSFSGLNLRWGWYGPEAVFRNAELGEPGGSGAFLRAPRLVVALDSWNSLRSGHLEAGRITLMSPDIRLRSTQNAAAGIPPEGSAAREDVVSTGARVLARWRGGRIIIEEGTLRSPGTPPFAVTVRHLELRRLGSEWRMQGQLRLPENLGADVHLDLSMTGDPVQPAELGGTLTLDAERLEFGGWHALAARSPLERYLPEAGRGNLEARAEFARGRLLRATGQVRAEALEWSAPVGTATPLTLARLRGSWQLAARGADWHLTLEPLELGEGPAPGASFAIDVAGDASWARGTARHAPLPALAVIARWYAPELPLAELSLAGEARELAFDWNGHRPAGARLATTAQVESLTLATPRRDVALSGLSGRLAAGEGKLLADLTGEGAQLALAREENFTLDRLGIGAHLAIATDGGGWQLSVENLEVRRADLNVVARGAIGAAAPGAPRQISAQVAMRDADIGLLGRLLGPRGLGALDAMAARLTAGRVANAEFTVRGPLDALGTAAHGQSEFKGTLELRDASLTGGDLWPDSANLGAHVEWRGARVRAVIDRGESGTFHIARASADWDTGGEHPTHLTARLSGSLPQALAWLRDHPQLTSFAPGVENIDLRGESWLDVEATLPAARAKRPPPERVRVVAALDGAELRPLAGLPPIRSLRGTLGFSAGHLQHSTLVGQWLGGPVSLGVGERRERGMTLLTISGRGLLGVREAVREAGGKVDESMPEGNAEWNALLTLAPEPGAEGTSWRVRGDSTLSGVTSRLPEPFAKSQNAALPLHLEAHGGSERGELHLSLGEKVWAVASLSRSGELWRIERGALRLGTSAPALPDEPVMLIDGRVSRLDLPEYLLLWQEAGRDAALPRLAAHLSATRLLIGAQSYPEVSLAALAAHGGGEVRLSSAALEGEVRWPAVGDRAHPAQLHLASFDLGQFSETALAADLTSVLGPALELSIDDLRWQGRPLGKFEAALARTQDVIEVST